MIESDRFCKKIYLGIGSNLNGKNKETPLENCKNVINELSQELNVKHISSWYKTEPVPVSDQPWYVNGIVQIETDKPPLDLLNYILKIEENFGRIRKKKNEARILDLDIIDYKQEVNYFKNKLITPHPRMHERAFVLLPLRELNTVWTHPQTMKSIDELIDNLDDKQKILKIIKK